MIRPRNDAIACMNNLGRAREPFLFFTDFEASMAYVAPLSGIGTDLFYEIKGQGTSFLAKLNPMDLTPETLPFSVFEKAFSEVQKEINRGNSFLTNLTFSTPIQLSCSLQEVFQSSQAIFKIYYPEKFVCFSPEQFVTINEQGKIASYPMKGTIDAAIPDAEQVIMNDPKEIAEHVTIIDLIRNDLSRIATDVSVPRFRYIDRIFSREKELLQVSSEVTGQLPQNWTSQIGSLLFELLPAGSISGAPKPKTVEIIKENETHDRKFYTGVCGLFDGKTLSSGVMIRFIEKTKKGLVYKSGAGITAQSDVQKEYQEILDKIYVPIS